MLWKEVNHKIISLDQLKMLIMLIIAQCKLWNIDLILGVFSL